MKFFRKGQTATEYLIILAVVIVIALVVVVAMGRFPGIGSNVGTQGAQAYWSTQDVGVMSLSLNEGGTGQITLRNNMRNAVIINNISIEPPAASDADIEYIDQDLPTLSPGGQQQIDIDMDGFCTAEQNFFVALTITYTDLQTGSQYRITGDGNYYEANCAI